MAVSTTELAPVSWARMTRAASDLTESEAGDQFRLVTLPALLGMKLVSFRDKDRTHLRDLIELGLVDASWLDRLPSPLAARLRELLENPE